MAIFREIRHQKRTYVYLLAKLHGLRWKLKGRKEKEEKKRKVESV